MKRLLLAVAVLGALTVPVGTASAHVSRAVATDCVNTTTGPRLRAWKVVPGQPVTEYRPADVPCTWVPDPWGKPWYILYRPQTDLEAAARASRYWWGHCTRLESGSYWGGHPYFGGTPGFYYKWYDVHC